MTRNTIRKSWSDGVELATNDVAPATVHSSLQAVNELLARRFAGKNIRLYEAGGGSLTFISSNIRSHAEVTVLDIDKAQLEKNTYADKKILGDVQTYKFPPASFELIVCYNVIEHLDAPDRAIALFYDALAPGGLLLIGAPNPVSLNGLVTRLTPHWFHVWYYKRFLGRTQAGQPGHGPFRTVYHPVVNPKKLTGFCERLGFRVVYFTEYQSDLLRLLRERWPLLGRFLNMTASVANALTFWRRDLRNGDFHMILERPAANQ